MTTLVFWEILMKKMFCSENFLEHLRKLRFITKITSMVQLPCTSPPIPFGQHIKVGSVRDVSFTYLRILFQHKKIVVLVMINSAMDVFASWKIRRKEHSQKWLFGHQTYSYFPAFVRISNAKRSLCLQLFIFQYLSKLSLLWPKYRLDQMLILIILFMEAS